MSAESGVNPLEAMNEAEAAEALAEAMVFLGVDFENASESLRAAVSTHVTLGLDTFEGDTHGHIKRVAQNGVNLAQNVQSADLAIVDTDHENAEAYQEGLEALDIKINF